MFFFFFPDVRNAVVKIATTSFLLFFGACGFLFLVRLGFWGWKQWDFFTLVWGLWWEECVGDRFCRLGLRCLFCDGGESMLFVGLGVFLWLGVRSGVFDFFGSVFSSF